MCLGVPGRVVEVDGSSALVDFFGVQRHVRLELVDQPVAPGDYILNHVGYAIRRIPEADIEGTLDDVPPAPARGRRRPDGGRRARASCEATTERRDV